MNPLKRHFLIIVDTARDHTNPYWAEAIAVAVRAQFPDWWDGTAINAFIVGTDDEAVTPSSILDNLARALDMREKHGQWKVIVVEIAKTDPDGRHVGGLLSAWDWIRSEGLVPPKPPPGELPCP